MSQIIFSDGPLIMASLKKEAHINWASPSHRGGVCVVRSTPNTPMVYVQQTTDAHN